MKISKTDIIIICVILLFSAGGYVLAGMESGNADKTAVIEVGGEVFGRYPMQGNTLVDVNGKNTVEITSDYVRVVYADCPDKLDVRRGKITRSGEIIVCLPNRMTVRIEGSDNKYDAISS